MFYIIHYLSQTTTVNYTIKDLIYFMCIEFFIDILQQSSLKLFNLLFKLFVLIVFCQI